MNWVTKLTVASLFLLTGAQVATAGAALAYKNSRFGYSAEIPIGLTEHSRAADGSGVTWRTGTFRIVVSAANNPNGIKPHELFSGMREEAGKGLIEELEENGKDFYSNLVVFEKNGRRFHKKLFVSGSAMNRLEVSYDKSLAGQKGPVARQVVASFRHGDLLHAH